MESAIPREPDAKSQGLAAVMFVSGLVISVAASAIIWHLVDVARASYSAVHVLVRFLKVLVPAALAMSVLGTYTLWRVARRRQFWAWAALLAIAVDLGWLALPPVLSPILLILRMLLTVVLVSALAACAIALRQAHPRFGLSKPGFMAVSGSVLWAECLLFWGPLFALQAYTSPARMGAVDMRGIAAAILMYSSDSGDTLPRAENWQTEAWPYAEVGQRLDGRGMDVGRIKDAGLVFNARLSSVKTSAIRNPYNTMLVFEGGHGWNVSGGPELLPMGQGAERIWWVDANGDHRCSDRSELLNGVVWNPDETLAEVKARRARVRRPPAKP